MEQIREDELIPQLLARIAELETAIQANADSAFRVAKYFAEMKNMNIEEVIKRKTEPPDIKTLSARTQVTYNWVGAYDMCDGSVHIGCDEKHISTLLWHETFHMIFFEQFFLEACKMWDNIADDLQKFLFDQEPQDLPFIFTQPPSQPKSKDNNAWIGNGTAGIRKQKEKSITTGWKPQTTKRIPPRKPCDHEKTWTRSRATLCKPLTKVKYMVTLKTH